jgi:hypothetical protein
MIDVLGELPDESGKKPKHKYRQYDYIKGKKEVCGKPQKIGNIICYFFSP